jgi:hypothetical protein
MDAKAEERQIALYGTAKPPTSFRALRAGPLEVRDPFRKSVEQACPDRVAADRVARGLETIRVLDDACSAGGDRKQAPRSDWLQHAPVLSKARAFAV